MADNFFITTAIDYTNGAPHIGHAYEKVLADVIARYHRLKGESVFYLTGVDQHGQKVQQSAEKQGIEPQKFVDGLTEKFVALWDKLDVRYERWAATTDASHKQCVRAILQRLWDEKDATGQSRWLYKTKQGGWYSVRQEQFLTDKERGEDGEFGPEWGDVEFREEENYYFRLTEHRDWLLALLESRPELVTPDFRRGELRNAVEKLSGDLCISRPKSRLAWGIELPFDPEFVTFVWFDALVNYISFAPGYDPAPGADLSEFNAWWPALHVIGKDILIPAHGVYWPIMLKALGFSDADIPILLVHGWWNIGGTKMSKTLGNVVDPDALADKYGAEALRYYLMSDITTGRDADFSDDRLITRFNSDLAKNLGNLLNRSLNMAHKYRGGVLKKTTAPELLVTTRDALSFETVGELYRSQFDGCAVNLALETALLHATACNQFIDLQKPWTVAKHPDLADRLDAILYQLAESLRFIAILLSPIVPKAARGIFDQLGVTGEFGLGDAKWGVLPDGHRVGTPVPLFPQIERPEGE
ncbi:MAG: methionyl-tRNA synthetase [Chthoniobacteraceae bacterium]|nr:methionyl-tRNA synthetase [Chthoniobacteraceae bacterium]